ncbi:hypothetical protein [Nostoc sp.]|uniref:hypothetical protein n=1 Tax=Nostoc sp. TaxID=1180 RepID=UPI002FFA2088
MDKVEVRGYLKSIGRIEFATTQTFVRLRPKHEKPLIFHALGVAFRKERWVKYRVAATSSCQGFSNNLLTLDS